jgi:hypothetical protein
MTMSDWVTFLRLMSPYVLCNAGVHEDVLALWAPSEKQPCIFKTTEKAGTTQATPTELKILWLIMPDEQSRWYLT